MFKKDNFILGLLIGALLPMIVYLLLEEFAVVTLYTGKSVPRFDPASMLVLSLVANILPFRQYMQKGTYEKTGKGILLMTFIYAGVYVYLKF
jgi:hypothetical protein